MAISQDQKLLLWAHLATCIALSRSHRDSEAVPAGNREKLAENMGPSTFMERKKNPSQRLYTRWLISIVHSEPNQLYVRDGTQPTHGRESTEILDEVKRLAVLFENICEGIIQQTE